MRRAPRRDDDRIDVLRRNELFAGRVDARARQPRGDFPRPGRIRVAERDHARSNKGFGQPSNVLLPDLSNSDDADVQCHELASLDH